MNKLDPLVLLTQIANDVPKDLHQNLFLTGSLAAAYHYRAKLEGRAVNTKDADLVVHPAGNIVACQRMTERLLATGWTRTDECYPKQEPDPADELRAIRLYPPGSKEYFIEFLNLPAIGEREPKRWIPFRLPDGWYGLPSFRFLGITSLNRLVSEAGLEYASPPMMALANLLSHPCLGTARIEAGPMRGLLRSAKDLGRVLALARLAGRDATEAWLDDWKAALRQCFPMAYRVLATQAGQGLRELLADSNILEDARKTTDAGLLNGMDVTVEMLQAIGERLFQDLIDPLNV